MSAARAFALFALFGVVAFVALTGCGEESGSARPKDYDPVDAAPPPAAEPLPDPGIIPRDDAQIGEWIREHKSTYVEMYRFCEADPLAAVQGAAAPMIEAQSTLPARYVARQGCMDGISQTPWPLPELEPLRPAD